ncbi:cytochrome P450 [Cryobacterium sp. Hh38]|nr:cytochrome P450 [Cryobacterium sp. Hh38]
MGPISTPPVADWIDPGQLLADPYSSYERLRELGPVVYVPQFGRYLLTTHPAVVAAEQQSETFSSFSNTNLTMMRALGGRPMLRKDDPEHADERSAINPTLRPRQVTNVWSPHFAENVEKWIDHLLEVGPADADLNLDFAAPVASQNLIDILGFPASVNVEDMRRWSTNYIAGIGNILDEPEIWRRCEESQAEVNAVLDELLPRMTKAPDASVTSHLLQVGLPDDVVRANVHLTISGGMNEPQHMITSMVWALSNHPDQLTALRTGDAEWAAAFEETVRWLSPIGMVPRETTSDVDWFGYTIPAGANVGLLLGSANRDADVFANANEFDITRNARGHLGFGSGVHMCAGRWATKAAVGEIAVPRLFERIPNIRIDESRPLHWEGWVFRGITTLPVTW